MFNFISIRKKDELRRLEEEHQENKYLQQKEYKDKIDRLYFEIKDNPEVITILENFFPEIPIGIFIYKVFYTAFEYLLSEDCDIGRKVLWSSDDDLRKIRHEAEQIFPDMTSFVNDDLPKMKKLLKSMITYENEYDYTFVLLRLLQGGAQSIYSQVFTQLYNVDFGNIEAKSLEECLFVYFNKCKNVFDDIFGDPGISFITYYMIHNEKFFGDVENIDYLNYVNRRDELIQLLNNKKEDFEYRIFEAKMKNKTQQNEDGYSIHDVDLMSGDEFEKFVAKIFSKMGYVSEVTKHTGDFGVDVIAEKDGMKIAIQAKCYAGSVSNSAVQEIVAGMKYYNCQRGVVVTNSTFTKAATELARKNTIQLWDRKILEEKISEIF